MNPHLCCTFDPKKLRFPFWHMPKIDGVRGLNQNGRMTTRRLKPFKNRHTQAFYSEPDYDGFDGELAAEYEANPDLCRLTTSATSTIQGTPETVWHLFDCITLATKELPYEARYDALRMRLTYLHEQSEKARRHLRIIPFVVCRSLEEFEFNHQRWVDLGYEGSILRDPKGLHKEGRCTAREGAYMRRKDFEDAEAVVVNFIEGNRNDNVAETNELGYTKRSSHQANMVPNGQVGTIVGRKVGSDEVINISPGHMSVALATEIWQNRAQYIGQTFTYKFFPHGQKDKPRFPIFKHFRDETDMSS